MDSPNDPQLIALLDRDDRYIEVIDREKLVALTAERAAEEPDA